MRHRPLGHSDLVVSEVGFGTWTLVTDWWGRTDDPHEMIRAALDAFKPDIFIVDKLPRGVCRELDPALELLRRTGTRCVLGLRDILDHRI